MNQTEVNQEWISSEIEKARSIINGFDENNCNNDGIKDNNNNNKKHDVLGELHSVFPSKTMQQVKDLYVDLVVEMLTVQHVAEYDGAIGEHGIINSVDGHMNDNFGIQEDASMYGVNLLSSSQIFDDMRVVEMEEVPAMERNKVEVSENKISIHQPIESPYARRFWTREEHRLLIYHPFKFFLIFKFCLFCVISLEMLGSF
jgi:hypothetical protein